MSWKNLPHLIGKHWWCHPNPWRNHRHCKVKCGDPRYGGGCQ